MRQLCIMDKKNYKIGGSVFSRPSVRAIIIKDKRIAMIHSRKYDYYKFPGGGIENNENHKKALIREVREESGLIIKPYSLAEYGVVRRIEKGKKEDIFIQDNFYYICDVENEIYEQELDEYELEERFSLEYIIISDAIKKNNNVMYYRKNDEILCRMLERENYVLEVIQDELMYS